MNYEEVTKKLLASCPPIPVEKLQAVKKVIVHGGGCPDGIASAMILNLAFNREISIEFVQHNSPEHKALVPEEGLLFCDFCPPEDRWEEFLDAGTLVLDHHKGVKNIAMAFVAARQGAFADETDHPGISGATLAYEYAWVPLQKQGTTPAKAKIVRELGRLAGVRDTWQTQDPSWTMACENGQALTFWPDPKSLLDGSIHDWHSYFDVGPILWEKKLKTAEKVGERAYHFVTRAGTRVAIFSGTRLSSDVAEYLGDRADIVIGYDLATDDGFNQVFSTRSRGTYDCKALAKAHGGGGHTKAAGFSVPLSMRRAPNPYKVAKIILNAYEGSTWDKIQKWFL